MNTTTPDTDNPAIARDPHGWVYRLIAPSADAAVLQVGDGGVQKWMADVREARLAEAEAAAARFDLVVLHYSLGGCPTLVAAVDAAVRLLKPGGRLAVAGGNRLRRGHASRQGAPGAAPRATPWAYRRALARAGLGHVALYFTHPAGSVPVYLVSSERRSARAFFRSASASRHRGHWSPRRLASAWLIESDVMPWLQPDLLVVGEKC